MALHFSYLDFTKFRSRTDFSISLRSLDQGFFKDSKKILLYFGEMWYFKLKFYCEIVISRITWNPLNVHLWLSIIVVRVLFSYNMRRGIISWAYSMTLSNYCHHDRKNKHVFSPFLWYVVSSLLYTIQLL